MLKIRLKRTGKKNAPSYRIVVSNSRSPRNGKAVEEIGWYNPSEDPNRIEYDKDRLEYWRSHGAQMTAAVEKIVKGEYEYVPYKGAEEEREEEAAEGGAVEGPAEKEKEQETQELESDEGTH